jgi:hypothetical protein
MGRRAPPPLRLQREESRYGQLIERLVPGPASVGDDARDQGVEIDFPGVGDASRVALAPVRSPAAFATEGKA